MSGFLSGLVSGFMATGGSSIGGITGGKPDASMNQSSMTPDSSGIISNDPYGTGSPSAGSAALSGFQKGSDAAKSGQTPGGTPTVQSAPIGMTYNALFGNQTMPGQYGGGQMSVQPIQTQAAIPMPQVQMPQTPMIAAPPQAPPMQMSALSDRYSKINIRQGNKELDDFLGRIYINIRERSR